MTGPVTPTYNVRDRILVNGVPSTVHSWPATNVGYASIEQYNAFTNSYTRLMAIVGTDIIAPYTGAAFPTSIDEPALTAQAELTEEEQVSELNETPAQELAAGVAFANAENSADDEDQAA